MAYAQLAKHARPAKLLLATYFAGLDDNTAPALGLPVQALHVDLVRAPGQLDGLLARWPADKILSAGVGDGRNISPADLSAALPMLQQAKTKAWSERAWAAPSRSLLH